VSAASNLAASGPIVARYAEALFGLAQRKGVLEEVARDIERLAVEVKSPTVSQFLLNPRRDRKERVARLASVLGDAQPMVRNFVSLLFERGREGVLLGMGPAFHRLRLEAAGIAEGVAETARPLDRAQLDALAQRLGARLGKKIQLTSKVLPELIGGVRVTVGSQRMDNSVAGRLAGLHRKLMDAPLPSRGA